MSGIDSQPTVTIGLAVRNGAASLDGAIDCLSRQTHRNLRIIISDNESTDETSAICEKWIRRDSRIGYVRQSKNLGAVLNFHFLLSQADSPYFMWAAHDDDWSPDYIQANLEVLASQPDVVCSVSKVELLDVPALPVPLIPGTDPLVDDQQSNLVEYLREPGANSRIYGLYRTDVLKQSFFATDTYWAFDWAIVARTLMRGKHALVPRTLMRRRCRGESSDAELNIRRFNPSWLSHRFPMLPFTMALLADKSIPKTYPVLKSLFRWNHVYLKNSIRSFKHRSIYPLLEAARLRAPRPTTRSSTRAVA